MHRIIVVRPGLVGEPWGAQEQGWLIEIDGTVQSALVKEPTAEEVQTVVKAHEKSLRKEYQLNQK